MVMGNILMILFLRLRKDVLKLEWPRRKRVRRKEPKLRFVMQSAVQIHTHKSQLMWKLSLVMTIIQMILFQRQLVAAPKLSQSILPSVEPHLAHNNVFATIQHHSLEVLGANAKMVKIV